MSGPCGTGRADLRGARGQQRRRCWRRKRRQGSTALIRIQGTPLGCLSYLGGTGPSVDRAFVPLLLSMKRGQVRCLICRMFLRRSLVPVAGRGRLVAAERTVAGGSPALHEENRAAQRPPEIFPSLSLVRRRLPCSAWLG